MAIHRLYTFFQLKILFCTLNVDWLSLYILANASALSTVHAKEKV